MQMGLGIGIFTAIRLRAGSLASDFTGLMDSGSGHAWSNDGAYGVNDSGAGWVWASDPDYVIDPDTGKWTAR